MPFVAGTGWGTYVQRIHPNRAEVELRCAFGGVPIRRLTLPVPVSEDISAALDERRLAFRLRSEDPSAVLLFDEPTRLVKGACLVITARARR